MVYLWSRQVFLRDRVAAVSVRVAEVVNGQKLEVLKHDRRFLQVRTGKNEVGWLPERAVIDSKTYDAFQKLAADHRAGPVVGDATLRSELYMHLKPGRDTDRFYLLAGNTKVQMLLRASVPKTPLATPVPQPALKNGKTAPAGSGRHHGPSEAIPGVPETPPVIMEDWWLVRDAQGHTGWMLGSRVDVDVPLSVAQYAEGQRIVGAWVIATVTDPEASTPDHKVDEYVMALSQPRSGLPYDFDQIRVYTWNLKRHRYETAFRLRSIHGYLPVRISLGTAERGVEPVFSFEVATSPDVAINPETGTARPPAPRTLSFALRQTIVRRVGPDMGPIPYMIDHGARKGARR